MRETRAGQGPALSRMIASRLCRASPKTPSIVPTPLSGGTIHLQATQPGKLFA